MPACFRRIGWTNRQLERFRLTAVGARHLSVLRSRSNGTRTGAHNAPQGAIRAGLAVPAAEVTLLREGA